jgi:hypothetical protein
MKRTLLLTVIIITVILAACVSAKELTGVWVNKEKMQGKTFHNFFIIVMTADIEVRVKLESDIAAIITSRGNKAVKSVDVMPPDLKNPRTPTKEEIIAKVKESGCDAVFASALLKKEEGIRYTPESTTYSPMNYYSYVGSYWGFYTNYYPMVSTAAYFSNDKTYFMMSNLYDVATDEIMWSAQSEIFNPSNLNSFSKSYISTLKKQLEKEKLIKK